MFNVRSVLRYSAKVTLHIRKMSSLARLGLTDTKIRDTQKNGALTAALEDMVTAADARGVTVDKSNGVLMYSLAAKLKSADRRPLILSLILDGKVVSDVQLGAAIDYVKNHPVHINQASLEEACGVGVLVTHQQIQAAVRALVAQHLDKIKQQRYRFNTGPLLGAIRKELKWADGGLCKQELDTQVTELIGPKTAEDEKPVQKQKVKQKVKQTEKRGNQEKEAAVNEPQEFSWNNFHKPGENYTTEGYVVTEHTLSLLKQHLEVTGGQWRTRFPPEPNGILHIGHAKAININFGCVRDNRGVCFLRYDDTNPEKEEEKFFDAILDMVGWLGYTPYKVTHSSDYFHRLFALAVQLIEEGNAYVCHQTADQMKGFDVAPSPWRDRPIAESLSLFEDMRNGALEEGSATLRIKHVLEEGKQDPVAYRIKFLPHHRTGDEWCIYPTYDYTHCLCDSFENITHSLCTKEFQSRRSSYFWLCNILRQYCPVQWEYGRLNIGYTIMSKRKIGKLISEGLVADFDDPRLFTLTALRRRGFPPAAINTFVKKLGLTGALTQLDPAMLESCVRDELNATAERVMAVLQPLKITVLKSGVSLPYTVSVADIPGQLPSHLTTITHTFYIDTSDFRLTADNDYRRLAPSQTVGLKHVGLVVEVVHVERSPDGRVSGLQVNLQQLDESNKPKAFIQWVSDYVVAEVRQYSRLFKHKCPEDIEQVPGGFLTDVNQDSLVVYQGYCEARVATRPVYTTLQFERIGYMCVDQDTDTDRIVFNNTVSLREDPGKS